MPRPAAQPSVQPTAAKKERVTLSAADWERAALDMIAETGVRSMGVEPLARRLGITKGSFYWHFANREALLEQALLRWEEHDAKNLNASLGQIEEPRVRLVSFFRRVGREKLTHEVYSALCAEPEQASVQPVLKRVAKRRMQHLAAAFQELGFSDEEALHHARLAYSAYLGYLVLQRQGQAPALESPEFEHYIEHVIQALIPS